MRAYVFTERERRILKAFINGKPFDRIELSKILYRFRQYETLLTDIDLYLTVRRRVTESKAA